MSKILTKNFAAVGAEFIHAVADGETTARKAGGTALLAAHKIYTDSGIGKITDDNWSETLRDSVRAECAKAWPNEATAKQRVKEAKGTIIAFSSGKVPKDGENMQAFYQRTRVAKFKRGTKGGKSGGKGKADKGGKGKVTMEVTREAALLLLAKGNKADARVIDFCVTVKMTTLRQLAADAAHGVKQMAADATATA